jgi:hypothetical protein
MVDKPVRSESPTCDGVDRGVSQERLQVLSTDAGALNRTLQQFKTDDHSLSHLDEADAAGKAFWRELIQAPIGERKMLLQLATEQNKVLAADDPAMPRIEFDMDSSAFLRKLTIKYPLAFSSDKDGKPKDFFRMDLVYQGWGMCAEFQSPSESKHDVPEGTSKGTPLPFSFQRFNWRQK